MEKNDEKRSIVNYNIFEKINHLKIEILWNTCKNE
jgi:hypothetical protein